MNAPVDWYIERVLGSLLKGRRRHRVAFIAVGVGILSVAAFLVLFALRDSVVGFHYPAQVAAKEVPEGRRIRLGGLVAAGSLKRDGLTAEFGITDNVKTVPARYTGVLPDLFREGQGVVAEGMIDAEGRFIADTVLAKHDENYMPPEVAKLLKDQGVWQHAGQGSSPSPRATPTSSQAPTAPAPYPNPLPASGERGPGVPK
jgi:cytochrome c-type biogenesis protein CcmE